MPLMEVDWLKRIALGTPREGEGHSAEQKKLCLAIVPWAPVPSGAAVLERYVKEVEKHAGDSFGKIKGFRYLVQDKPKGTMLQDGFIEGLKWLGRKGYVFDLGVDQHSGGKWQQLLTTARSSLQARSIGLQSYGPPIRCMANSNVQARQV
jgi:L-rhamnono-1,4-lactonase